MKLQIWLCGTNVGLKVESQYTQQVNSIYFQILDQF